MSNITFTVFQGAEIRGRGKNVSPVCGDIYDFRVPGFHADVLVEVGIGFDMHICRFKRIHG